MERSFQKQVCQHGLIQDLFILYLDVVHHVCEGNSKRRRSKGTDR